MEIDKQSLIKLLEAFADSSEVLQRELMLYQMLFASACKVRGLTEEEAKKAVDIGRAEASERIKKACQSEHQALLAKLPQLVDLLVSNQDVALRFLKEWTPKGPPN
jgi:hypothetical protein